jgi:hypothetical protein
VSVGPLAFISGFTLMTLTCFTLALLAGFTLTLFPLFTLTLLLLRTKCEGDYSGIGSMTQNKATFRQQNKS